MSKVRINEFSRVESLQRAAEVPHLNARKPELWHSSISERTLAAWFIAIFFTPLHSFKANTFVIKRLSTMSSKHRLTRTFRTLSALLYMVSVLSCHLCFPSSCVSKSSRDKHLRVMSVQTLIYYSYLYDSKYSAFSIIYTWDIIGKKFGRHPLLCRKIL